MLVDSHQVTATAAATTPTKKAKLGDSAGRKIHNNNNTNDNSLHSAATESEIEGQFSCEYCDKAFSKQSSLARHRYEHSGEDCNRFLKPRFRYFKKSCDFKV